MLPLAAPDRLSQFPGPGPVNPGTAPGPAPVPPPDRGIFLNGRLNCIVWHCSVTGCLGLKKLIIGSSGWRGRGRRVADSRGRGNSSPERRRERPRRAARRGCRRGTGGDRGLAGGQIQDAGQVRGRHDGPDGMDDLGRGLSRTNVKYMRRNVADGGVTGSVGGYRHLYPLLL